MSSEDRKTRYCFVEAHYTKHLVGNKMEGKFKQVHPDFLPEFIAFGAVIAEPEEDWKPSRQIPPLDESNSFRIYITPKKQISLGARKAHDIEDRGSFFLVKSVRVKWPLLVRAKFAIKKFIEFLKSSRKSPDETFILVVKSHVEIFRFVFSQIFYKNKNLELPNGLISGFQEAREVFRDLHPDHPTYWRLSEQLQLQLSKTRIKKCMSTREVAVNLKDVMQKICANEKINMEALMSRSPTVTMDESLKEVETSYKQFSKKSKTSIDSIFI